MQPSQAQWVTLDLCADIMYSQSSSRRVCLVATQICCTICHEEAAARSCMVKVPHRKTSRAQSGGKQLYPEAALGSCHRQLYLLTSQQSRKSRLGACASCFAPEFEARFKIKALCADCILDANCECILRRFSASPVCARCRSLSPIASNSGLWQSFFVEVHIGACQFSASNTSTLLVCSHHSRFAVSQGDRRRYQFGRIDGV